MLQCQLLRPKRYSSAICPSSQRAIVAMVEPSFINPVTVVPRLEVKLIKRCQMLLHLPLTGAVGSRRGRNRCRGGVSGLLHLIHMVLLCVISLPASLPHSVCRDQGDGLPITGCSILGWTASISSVRASAWNSHSSCNPNSRHWG